MQPLPLLQGIAYGLSSSCDMCARHVLVCIECREREEKGVLASKVALTVYGSDDSEDDPRQDPHQDPQNAHHPHVPAT